ncbi:response regulator [Reichenbachiella carrageenanivorans]|uniref:Response regulator n=1 Tax=Reichenbachiella carrageenanivorans TaxID=2979869 RepID=A0ABY6CYJ1_9BACT|nr:response regulator [Reichenbachiella carrageenanivorans]UXX78977.1 response regulator [Reichenbachiella carrageenanivorans]
MELVLQRPQRKESVKKYSILYVDDEPVNLRIFQHAFKRDYNVYTSLNGFDALEILNEKKVDLIITDQQMPRMSGVDLLAKIVPKHPSIVRMIMTGFSDIGAIIRAVNEFGLDKYLVKPWDRDQLKVEFDKALEKKSKQDKAKTGKDGIDVADLVFSFLPNENDLVNIYSDGFVVYDKNQSNQHGYWFGHSNDKAITAFYNGAKCKMNAMALNSYINMSLTELIYKDGVLKSAEIIKKLAAKIKTRFGAHGDIGSFDIAVVTVDQKAKKVSYAGANQDIYCALGDGELKSVKGSTESIDLNDFDGSVEQKTFENISTLYLISKEMINQIIPSDDPTVEGKNFLQMLKGYSKLPLAEQANHINEKLSGDNSKCMLGIKL